MCARQQQVYSIEVGSKRLISRTVDGLFNKIALFEEHVKDSPCDSVEINLSGVEFIDPYGMVCLYSAVQVLYNLSEEVICILPTCLETKEYLARMEFFDKISDFVEMDETWNDWEYDPESEVLLELTTVGNGKKSRREVRRILERIGKILHQSLAYEAKHISCIETVVSELCHNIVDHSESSGAVAVQQYTRRDGTRFLVIGVSDIGIGIRESLGKRYDVKGWTHFEALVNSFKKEYSRFPDRGLGLYRINQIIKDYGGSLDIRTGDTRLHLRTRANAFTSSEFPGTHVSISLSEVVEENA